MSGSTIIGFAGVAAAGATVHAFEWKEGVGERITPFQTVVYKNGSFAIRGVPAGHYLVRLGRYLHSSCLEKGYHLDCKYCGKRKHLIVDGSKEYCVELIEPDELDAIIARNRAETPVTETAVTVDNSITENPVIENPVVENPAVETPTVVESSAQAESVKTTENTTTENTVIVAAVETPIIAG